MQKAKIMKLMIMISLTFINLKRHGQWKSDTVIGGYIANSEPVMREREECLLPASLVQAEPETIEGSKGLTTFDNLYQFTLQYLPIYIVPFFSICYFAQRYFFSPYCISIDLQ